MSLRRILILHGPLLLLLSACVSTLPVQTPSAPTPPPASASPTTAAAETMEVFPTQTPHEATAAPTPTLSPVPAPDPILARDLALDYLQQGYQLSLPPGEAFAETDASAIEITGLEAHVAYAADNWRVALGLSDITPPGAIDVVIDNHKTDARWWGQVDSAGFVVTVVGVNLPRPPSKAVVGWKGVVHQFPAGSPYDDYFEGAKGNRHGITSNDSAIQSILQALAYYEGRVQIWGELRYAAKDVNGRQILVDRIELLDGPLPEIALQTDSTPAAPSEEGAILGPTGVIFSPAFGTMLVDHVLVEGEAEGIFENQVLVRVEAEDGAVLGEAPATTDAPDIGQRGRFVVDVPFANPPAVTEGRVALYSADARDGSLNLLAWVNVRYAGAASDQLATILSPEPNTRIKGQVNVSGTAVGVHERRVLVRIEDLTGVVWGKKRTQTDGIGNWQVNITMQSPPTARPGRIAVYDVDPETGLRVLLAEQPVYLRR